MAVRFVDCSDSELTSETIRYFVRTPPSLLSNGYRGGLSHGEKRLRHEGDRSPPSRAKVNECVALYLHP